jgi:hypothetical protein
MPNVKMLTKKQRAVIDDLFAGVADEQQVLDKHKVSKRLYEKWLANENFAEEFENRLAAARRQSEMIIARYATFAAAKLVQLTESQNPETARKACLDIITLLRPVAERPETPSPEDNAESSAELPPEIASRLLSALASSNESQDISDK